MPPSPCTRGLLASRSYEGGEMMTLEDEFEQECDSAIEECPSLNPPYVPTAWIGMMRRHGAAEAARRLLLSGDIQSGFERLIHQAAWISP